jgi:hypothetical protein
MAALLVSHGRPGFYFRVLEEGEVGAGDEIVKVEEGPERVTVAEINALLYLPGHPVSGLERALRIPALSAGWRTSLEALLDRERKGRGITGNPGLGPPMGPPPAWQGFRSLRVLHALAAEQTRREIWWIHGARNSIGWVWRTVTNVAAASGQGLEELARLRCKWFRQAIFST